MKLFRSFLVLLVAIAACAAGALVVAARSVDPRAWRVAIDVWALNHGLVSVQDGDWHFLKLEAGRYGPKALDDLRRHGATDEVRIAADYVARYYVTAHDMCGDTSCGQETDMHQFQRVPFGSFVQRDLLPGQMVPHDFVIDTANATGGLWCGTPEKPDGCTLRMQDFDGDGQLEVYVERQRRDQSAMDREIYIYARGGDGWRRTQRVAFTDRDAQTFAQRPFALEPGGMDIIRINGGDFHFMSQPGYSFGRATDPHPPQRGFLKVLSAALPQVSVVYPKGASLPRGLAAALSSGTVGFAPRAGNPPLPNPFAGNGPPAIAYPQAPLCVRPSDCRAIVADLDHDGRDEVIVIADPSPGADFPPFRATLLKNDGRTWHVVANVDLCKEIVPDLARATIVIHPSRWRSIRLGRNIYPIGENPYCDNGLGGLE